SRRRRWSWFAWLGSLLGSRCSAGPVSPNSARPIDVLDPNVPTRPGKRPGVPGPSDRFGRILSRDGEFSFTVAEISLSSVCLFTMFPEASHETDRDVGGGGGDRIADRGGRGQRQGGSPEGAGSSPGDLDDRLAHRGWRGGDGGASGGGAAGRGGRPL